MKYDKYKNSGTEWLGDIPLDWKTGVIGSFYTLRNEKVSDTDYPPLSVTMKGIVPQLETAAKTDAHDARKLVLKGDFAINSRSDRRGSCGVSQYDGSVSLINTVLTPRNNMSPRYYDWLFHTVQFADEYYKNGHGIVDDLWTTRWNEMKRIIIPVPSVEIQEIIAEYLDKKIAHIESLIEEAKASIEEYKAWKASIIYEAVTKGLDPNVEMKDSGVEWISHIPANWNVKRTKALFSYGKGLPITKENLVEDGIPVISYGQIHSKKNTGTGVIEELIRFVPESYINSNPESLVKKGDILVADTSEDLAGCGNAVYVDSDMTLFAGYHTIILKSNDVSDNKYIAYLMKTDAWRSQIRANVSGVKLFSISKRILNSTSVILPSTEEQKEITNYLDTKCTAIDEIIAEKELLIFDLEKYKKSLIFDVVTGKRKV